MASTSNIENLECSESKALRMIVDEAWYVPNMVIWRNLQILTVREEICRYISQYSECSLQRTPKGNHSYCKCCICILVFKVQFMLFQKATRVLEPIGYRGVLVSILLHAIVYLVFLHNLLYVLVQFIFVLLSIHVTLTFYYLLSVNMFRPHTAIFNIQYTIYLIVLVQIANLYLYLQMQNPWTFIHNSGLSLLSCSQTLVRASK
jgi:hypothetical protein